MCYVIEAFLVPYMNGQEGRILYIMRDIVIDAHFPNFIYQKADFHEGKQIPKEKIERIYDFMINRDIDTSVFVIDKDFDIVCRSS